jgi:hypothetical protein
MTTIEYSLFRAKFVRSIQTSLFDFNKLTPEDIFIASLNERPSGELRIGNNWHIGNIEKFSNTTGYFAIGRTTKSTIEKFDDTTGNFIEEEVEEGPYTHCVFNAQLGLV